MDEEPIGSGLPLPSNAAAVQAQFSLGSAFALPAKESLCSSISYLVLDSKICVIVNVHLGHQHLPLLLGHQLLQPGA